jgi:hypothetical protein
MSGVHTSIMRFALAKMLACMTRCFAAHRHGHGHMAAASRSLRVRAYAGRSATIHACLVIQIAPCDQRLITACGSKTIQIRRSAHAAAIGGSYGKGRTDTDAQRKRKNRKIGNGGIRFHFTTPLCTNAPAP